LPRFRGALFVGAATAALLVCFAVLVWPLLSDGLYQLASIGQTEPPGVATFAGSETCAGCHRAEAALWHGSQHKQAMDHATEKSVLGDFNDASFDYHGVRSRFFRAGGKFLVETD